MSIAVAVGCNIAIYIIFILLMCMDMDALPNKKRNEFERIVYSLDGNISTLLNNAPNVTDRKICTRQ